MTHYTLIQEANLRELRMLFGEAKYSIYSIRKPKHVLEFIAVKLREGGGGASCAIARMYRGRVRIQIFHSFRAMFGMCEKIKKRISESEVFISEQLFNPTRYGNFRSWDELARKSEVNDTMPIN